MYLEGILRITAVPLREKRTVKTDFHAFYPHEHNFSLCSNKLLIVLKISFIYTVVIKPYYVILYEPSVSHNCIYKIDLNPPV